jgi:uncharacterized membrane protein (UPF0127 family)
VEVRIGENIISNDMRIANGFFSRMIGLMFKKKMQGYDSLLIKRCNSIHTFFMLFSIDAIFLNKDYKVIKIYKNLKPWRMTRVVWKASQVLELYSGTVPEGLKEGDSITVCTN